MEELNSKQEDIMLEQAREKDFEKRAEPEQKKCELCKSNTFNCDKWIELDFKGSDLWVCENCYEELQETNG